MNATAQDKTRKEYIKLAVLKQNLKKVCSNLNKEMVQTDIEWMNLVALSKNLNANNQPSTSKQVTPTLSTPSCSCEVDRQMTFTKPQEGLPQLYLDPHMKGAFELLGVASDEEFDSD